MAKKIVIASGKGGVGKSTLTTGLSVKLASFGKKILVIDADIGLRSLDLMLGVRDRVLFDWGDIILERCDRQAALLRTRNIDLLAAPLRTNDLFNRENFRELVKSFDNSYDYILIDAAAGITGGFRLAVGAADSALLVATPDDISVRSAAVAADEIIGLGVSDHRLLINRLKKKDVYKNRLLNIDQVIDSTGVQLMGVVPEDDEISFCATRGCPFPDSSVGNQAFGRIAKRIMGQNIPLVL